MPPVAPAGPPRCAERVCRLTRLTPSTITRSARGSTAITLPSTPLSLPAMTRTWSPFLMFTLISQHLRGKRDDAHEPLLPQLAAHRAEDAGTPRLTVASEDHGGVLVEPDVRAVRPAALLRCADNDGTDEIALLHVDTGDRILDGGDDGVADPRVAATGSAQHTDAQDLLGSGVVGDLEPRLLLDHRLTPVVSLVLAPQREPGGTYLTPRL